MAGRPRNRSAFASSRRGNVSGRAWLSGIAGSSGSLIES
jgi:hypothetical protein